MPKITKLLVEISNPEGGLLDAFFLEGSPDADRRPLVRAIRMLLADNLDLEEIEDAAEGEEEEGA